jgi:hypothetical protein
MNAAASTPAAEHASGNRNRSGSFVRIRESRWTGDAGTGISWRDLR